MTQRTEIESAFEEFLDRGARSSRWVDWAALFADDAVYLEHCLGTRHGRDEIEAWITAEMARLPNMTFSTEWYIVDGDRVAFWVWNHLPDPNDEGVGYGFPNLSVLTYAGNGQWAGEEDFYHPKSAGAIVAAWLDAGGTPTTPADRDIAPLRPSHPALPIGVPDHGVLEAVADALVSENWLDLIAWGADYHDHGRRPIQRWADVPRAENYRVLEGSRIVLSIQHEVPAALVAHVNESGRVTYLDHIYNPYEQPT